MQQNISVEKCKKMLDEKSEDFVLLDVRTANEVSQGAIEGAVHIPLDELEQRVNELDASQTVFVYCASGNRSRVACDVLQVHGFENCVNVDGGVTAWKDAGFTLV